MAAAEVDPWQARLRDPQQDKSRSKVPLRDGPSNPAETDWPRVIAGNLPAAFIVFAGARLHLECLSEAVSTCWFPVCVEESVLDRTHAKVFQILQFARFEMGSTGSGVACSAGIAAIDVSTGFDITRIALRYGGPGAPPSAVLAFWPTALAAAGLLSTALTSLLSLEAFGLKGKCPDCGTVNRAGFKGVLGHGEDAEISQVVCHCLHIS